MHQFEYKGRVPPPCEYNRNNVCCRGPGTFGVRSRGYVVNVMSLFDDNAESMNAIDVRFCAQTSNSRLALSADNRVVLKTVFELLFWF